MTEMHEATARSPRSSAISWTVRVLLSVVFLYAGAEKLFASGGMWVRLFDQIGFGAWFRYFTAIVEMTAGVLMLVPRLSAAGAVLAMSSMIGALIVHATVIGFGPPTIVVSILLALSSYVAWSGRHQIPGTMRFKVTRRKLFGSGAALFALYLVWNALPGREFDVTGRWVGRTLNGIQIGLELKADGSVLSGTLTRNRSGRPITAGKVTAEGLSFNAMLGRQVESFSGTYRIGERLHVTIDSMGPLAFLTSVTLRRE